MCHLTRLNECNFAVLDEKKTASNVVCGRSRRIARMTGHVEVEVLVLVLATATITELLANGIPQTV